MRIKAQVLIMGLATLIFTISSLVEFVKIWIIDNGLQFRMDFYFVSRPLSILIEVTALLVATFFFNKKLFRLIGLLVFIILRIADSIYVYSWYVRVLQYRPRPISFFLENIIGIPSFDYFSVYTVFPIIEFIVLILIVASNILDLVNKNSRVTEVSNSFPSSNASPQIQAKYHPTTNNIAQPVNFAQVSSPVIGKIDDVLDNDAYVQIERFGDLLARGLITQEEFELKKKKILGI
jgi:hypothetical protein